MKTNRIMSSIFFVVGLIQAFLSVLSGQGLLLDGHGFGLMMSAILTLFVGLMIWAVEMKFNI